MITKSQIINRYGLPNDTGKGYLTQIVLPYPMKLSWDTDVVVNKISCHKLVANRLTSALKDILSEYGIDEIKRLGIDLYGGCFNYRKMRGGNDWSTHAWGIAIDLDPERNGLNSTRDTAQFAKPEYKKMIECFYNNGFESLGVEKNYDWMHFQIEE